MEEGTSGESGRDQRAVQWRKSLVFMVLLVAMMTVAAVTVTLSTQKDVRRSSHRHNRRLTEMQRIPVYSSRPEKETPIVRKLLNDLNQILESDTLYFESISLTNDQQRHFIQENCGKNAATRFDEFLQLDQVHFGVEVFKWCALGKSETSVYLDTTSPLLARLHDIVVHDGARSFVVLADDRHFPRAMTGPFVLLLPQHSSVATEMLRLLVETSLDVFDVSPLLVPHALYSMVAKLSATASEEEAVLKPGNFGRDWKILQQSCLIVDPLRGKPRGAGDQLLYHCPEDKGFCCSVHNTRDTVFMTHYPLIPVHKLPSNLLQPYNVGAGHSSDQELPYISTIQELVHTESSKRDAPNFYDMLPKNCLSDDCSKCIRDKKGANCHSCKHICSCYCEKLCKEAVPEKTISKTWYVTPPTFSRDPNRLVPRIVHQTWFEDLNDRSKYPNMSRLVESFKKSGWEYKFYNDEDAATFLNMHFPPEVREAYDAIKPGAFKADLFRYCVLLIYGGVYADVDIQLESSLDFAVPLDVGLMVPIDEPGKPVNHQMCLWNGFIAAAPGHPVLAKAIETVVNQVRNRFTSVDVDATFCPSPELSVLHAYDTLFTAGPCLLGATLNRVLGRHGQTSFVPGELDPWSDFSQRQLAIQATSFVEGADDKPERRIPGRVVLLKQNKWDMGAHRFTLLERNLVVSATDLPDSNDRENLEGSSSAREHYSKTHAKVGIYGLEHLYIDQEKAQETVRIVVKGDKLAKKVQTSTNVM